MENATTITATPIAPAKPAAGAAPAKPAAKAPAPGAENNGKGEAGTPKPQGSQPKPQAPGQSPDKPRTIAELNAAAKSGGANPTRAEKERIKIASRHGLTTEAEIDAKIAETSGAPGATKPHKPAVNAPPKAPKPAPVTSKAQTAGIPDPDDAGEGGGEDDEILPGGGEGDEILDDELDDGDDELLNVLGVKNRADKKAAIESAKFIKQRSDNFGQLTNELKTRGIENARDLFGVIEAATNADAAVQEYLRRGPEGVAELFRVMDVPMPQNMSFGGVGGQQGAPGGFAGAGQGAQGGQPVAPTALDFGIGETEFIDGKTFNSLMPRIVQQIAQQVLGQVSPQIKPLQERFDKMAPHLQQIATTSLQQQEATSAFRDVRAAMSTIADFNPDYNLTDTPENIWAESVGPDGRVAVDHHPEWPKLASILKERTEAKKKNYPSLRSYLADRLLSRGKVTEHVNGRVAKSQVELAKAKARRMQPGLDAGRKPGAAATFVMPKTREEMRALKETNPTAYAEAKSRLRKGQY